MCRSGSGGREKQMKNGEMSDRCALIRVACLCGTKRVFDQGKSKNQCTNLKIGSGAITQFKRGGREELKITATGVVDVVVDLCYQIVEV